MIGRFSVELSGVHWGRLEISTQRNNSTMTVFITCFYNLVVRNILETGLFQKLRGRSDLKVILLVPEKKGDFFRKEFGGANVTVEEVPARPMPKINLLFHVLSWNLLRTRSKKIHRLVQLGKDR